LSSSGLIGDGVGTCKDLRAELFHASTQEELDELKQQLAGSGLSNILYGYI